MSEEDKLNLSQMHSKILDLNNGIKHCQNLCAQRDKTIVELNQEIQKTQGSNTDQSDKIRQLNNTIDNRDQEIAHLKQQIALIKKEHELDMNKRAEYVRQLQQLRNEKYKEVSKHMMDTDTLLKQLPAALPSGGAGATAPSANNTSFQSGGAQQQVGGVSPQLRTGAQAPGQKPAPGKQ